jgi:hypothetical protein
VFLPPLCTALHVYAVQDPTKCSNSAEAFAAYTALGQEPGAFVYAADVLWNAGGCHQSALGLKGPRGVEGVGGGCPGGRGGGRRKEGLLPCTPSGLDMSATVQKGLHWTV